MEQLFPAVVQKYDATVSREDILLSNDVLFKCGIPSFVADFVSVVGWVDSEGSGYDANDQSALGNLLVYCTETSIFAFSFKDSIQLDNHSNIPNEAIM